MKYSPLFLLSLFTAVVAFFSLPPLLHADDGGCIVAYNNMTELADKGGAAASVCNYCRAVFLLKQALDWLGKCEVECAANREKMIMIRQYKPDLIKALEIYGMRCRR
ncbi:MAG: hypothetical protein ABSB79_09730 [Syntrophales bacterium]|jgi:hypothetical protein